MSLTMLFLYIFIKFKDIDRSRLRATYKAFVSYTFDVDDPVIRCTITIVMSFCVQISDTKRDQQRLAELSLVPIKNSH